MKIKSLLFFGLLLILPAPTNANDPVELVVGHFVSTCIGGIQDLATIKNDVKQNGWQKADKKIALAGKPPDATDYEAWYIGHLNGPVYISVGKLPVKPGRKSNFCSFWTSYKFEAFISHLEKKVKLKKITSQTNPHGIMHAFTIDQKSSGQLILQFHYNPDGKSDVLQSIIIET